MKKVSVVIGANYGDEGKGMITDYLSFNAEPSTIVARFSGGANAGHTVELADGKRHIFSHFGAGTLASRETLLTEDFIVNPVLFWQEALALTKKIPQLPHCYIDPRCMVTTPYDVFINQAIERQRDGFRHGSTGVGLGETIERQERGYGLRVMDLLDEPEEIIHRLTRIRDEYLFPRLEELGIEDIDTDILEDVHLRFLKDAQDMISSCTVAYDTDVMNEFEHVIFEGSQGLYLDQNSEDFPHVTRANTGLTNLVQYLTDEHDIDIYYVTRSYLSRHGAGPLANEDFRDFGIVDKTNHANEFQGALRFAPLDLERMQREIQKDLTNVSGLSYNVVPAITWCDEVRLHETSTSTMIRTIAKAMTGDIDAPVITSWGTTRENINEGL